MTVMGCSALNRIWYDLGDKSDPKKLNLEAKQGGEQYCTKGNVTEQGLINFFLRNLGG